MNVRHVLAIIVASVLGVNPVASAAPADHDASGTGVSNLSVSPAQASLSPSAPSALFSLSNKSDQPLSFQLSAFEWKQADRDQMQLTPTDNVIVIPALLTLAPGEKRQILIAGRTFGSSEKAYRLVVQELQSDGEPGAAPAAMKMPARTTIPVVFEASR